MSIAKTPRPPYYAVIFSNEHTSDREGYAETASRMVELAQQQDGFLGVESASECEFGITVSYWRDEDSILRWKHHLEHSAARERGRSDWYTSFVTRVAKVERDYSFEKRH